MRTRAVSKQAQVDRTEVSKKARIWFATPNCVSLCFRKTLLKSKIKPNKNKLESLTFPSRNSRVNHMTLRRCSCSVSFGKATCMDWVGVSMAPRRKSERQRQRQVAKARQGKASHRKGKSETKENMLAGQTNKQTAATATATATASQTYLLNR